MDYKIFFLLGSVIKLTSIIIADAQDGCTSLGTACIGQNNYCPGSYNTGSTCIDGRCRCPKNPQRDSCTCLAISGQCRIKQDASSALGTPTFEGQFQTTYSCVANENCDYDVHIISNYEGDGHTGFRVHNTGTTNVQISVNSAVYRPIVLVFVSYEPVNWILSIPNGITIEKVLLGSYYLSNSNVTYSSGSVQSVERLSSLPNGYGKDDGGGNTDEVLEYVVGRFGPVASFSGSYRADRWTLDIEQNNTLQSGCTRSSKPLTTEAQDISKSRPQTGPVLTTASTVTGKTAVPAITPTTTITDDHSTLNGGDATSDGSKMNVAAIGGLVAGGVLFIVVVLVMITMIWICIRKPKTAHDAEIEVKENEAYGTVSSKQKRIIEVKRTKTMIYGVNPSTFDLQMNEAYGVPTGAKLCQKDRVENSAQYQSVEYDYVYY